VANEKIKFFAEYEDTTRDVRGSLQQFFRSNLQRWFSSLEETPEVREIVSQLYTDFSLNEWLQQFTSGHDFAWPSLRKDRLRAQLGLFRLFAEGKADAAQFGFEYIPSSDANINRALHRVVDQIYDPLVTELRRYIDQNWGGSSEVAVPASDRVVNLDHNSNAYKIALAKLSDVETALRDSNEVAPEEKEQHLAEIAATQEILKPKRVTVKAVVAVAGAVLFWLVKHFADSFLGQAADAAWTAIKGLLGI
jgi:hypothetical protein